MKVTTKYSIIKTIYSKKNGRATNCQPPQSKFVHNPPDNNWYAYILAYMKLIALNKGLASIYKPL
jgi:hypothetical protein